MAWSGQLYISLDSVLFALVFENQMEPGLHFTWDRETQDLYKGELNVKLETKICPFFFVQKS